MTEHNNGWRLSRTVPIVIVVVMIGYALHAVWWTSSLSANVNQNRRVIESRSSHALRLGVLEERWRNIIVTLKEIRDDVKALRRAQ